MTGTLVLVVLAGALQACATPPGATPAQRADPWEGWNRKVYTFNEKLDEAVLKPVATGYTKAVPRPVRRGIDNVFGNVGDAWSAVNNFLQGKFANGLQDVTRVGTNTLFGLGGIMDVAGEAGLDHQNEDLGQTLGRWGFGPGPYVVWPVFGPSTVRDSFALPLDRSVSPALFVHDGVVRWEIVTLQLVNARANLLGASNLLDSIALDKYTFVRDAYLQRRRSQVYDGDPPPEDDDAGPGAPEDQKEPAPAKGGSPAQ